jgi:hypothetical protein
MLKVMHALPGVPAADRNALRQRVQAAVALPFAKPSLTVGLRPTGSER